MRGTASEAYTMLYGAHPEQSQLAYYFAHKRHRRHLEFHFALKAVWFSAVCIHSRFASI